MASYGNRHDTIYIVDDDRAVGEALSSLLRASGKNVRLFTCGSEFLSFERDDTPGLPYLGAEDARGEWIRCAAARFGDGPDHLYYRALRCRLVLI